MFCIIIGNGIYSITHVVLSCLYFFIQNRLLTGSSAHQGCQNQLPSSAVYPTGLLSQNQLCIQKQPLQKNEPTGPHATAAMTSAKPQL
jgi:hypothetical protein